MVERKYWMPRSWDGGWSGVRRLWLVWTSRSKAEDRNLDVMDTETYEREILRYEYVISYIFCATSSIRSCCIIRSCAHVRYLSYARPGLACPTIQNVTVIARSLLLIARDMRRLPAWRIKV